MKGHEAEQVKQCVFLFFGGDMLQSPSNTRYPWTCIAVRPIPTIMVFLFQNFQSCPSTMGTAPPRIFQHRFGDRWESIAPLFNTASPDLKRVFHQEFSSFPTPFFLEFFLLGQEIRHPLHLLSRWWFDSTPNLGR